MILYGVMNGSVPLPFPYMYIPAFPLKPICSKYEFEGLDPPSKFVLLPLFLGCAEYPFMGQVLAFVLMPTTITHLLLGPCFTNGLFNFLRLELYPHYVYLLGALNPSVALSAPSPTGWTLLQAKGVTGVCTPWSASPHAW